MSGALLAASGAGANIIASNQNVIDFELSPDNASASYQVRSDGSVWALRVSDGNAELEKWIAPLTEAPGAYEINVTSTGDALHGTSAATGVDLALTSNRLWGVSETGIGSKSATLTVRFKLGGTVVKTVSVNVTATVEP